MQINNFETIINLIIDDILKSYEWSFILLILILYDNFKDIWVGLIVDNFKILLNYDCTFINILDDIQAYKEVYIKFKEYFGDKINYVRTHIGKLAKIGGIWGLLSLNLVIDSFLTANLNDKFILTDNIKKLFNGKSKFFKKI